MCATLMGRRMRLVQRMSTVAIVVASLALGSAAQAASPHTSRTKAVRAAGYTCTVVGTLKADKLVGQGSTTVSPGSAATMIDESNGSSSVSCAAPGGTVVIVGAGADDHQSSCATGTVVNAGLRLSGTVTAIGATTIDVQYDRVSDATVAWLAANGNPSIMTIDVSSATVTRNPSGSVTVGDTVRVAANAPTSGTTLVGVAVRANCISATPSEDGSSAVLELQESVTQASATSITVAYREVNKA